MKTFYKLIGNTLIVVTKNNFVWFALVFWAYLQTQSVISTSLIGGFFLLATSISSMWLGSLVDHYPKKLVLLGSSLLTLCFFLLALMVLVVSPATALSQVMSPALWLFAVLILLGVIAGNVFGIAVPTLVTVLVSEDERDKANGLFGSIMGVSFSITSVASGLMLAYAGMFWVLVVALVLTVVAMVHLGTVPLPKQPETPAGEPEVDRKIDVFGTIRVIKGIPGLFALIFFTTFNNFLGGAFMALMDAYGLTLVSVQVWGMLWGLLSLGFILGGMIIAKKGLGENPIKTLFRVNIVMWIASIFFTVQPSIVLLAVGILFWVTLVPFVEATEQTIIQKVVPAHRQGRVFGFAHSIEQAASPLTAFFIGPITQYIFIPFMTTGAGVELIGSWYGVGPGRGMALVFSIAGLIGLVVTLIAKRSRSYQMLYQMYSK